MLGVEHGQIVRGGPEARIQYQDLLEGLLRLRDVSLGLIYNDKSHLCGEALGIYLEGFIQLAHRLIVTTRCSIDLSKFDVGINEGRLQLDSLQEGGFGPVRLAPAQIHGAEHPLETSGLRQERDLL